MAITPTTITTEDQIYLAGSPINLDFSNLAVSNTIKSVVVELYIWSGALNAPPALPTKTLVASKVSKNDTKITIGVSEVIASYITGTKFAWVAGNNFPSVSGEGVFFQYKYQVTNESLAVETAVTMPTNFATLGYRYDFEQVGKTTGLNQPYLGLIEHDFNKRKYACNIRYLLSGFNLAGTLEETTSASMVNYSGYLPTDTDPQLGDKYIIAYINRLGLWDYFTPFGKAVKNIKVEGTTNPRLYRNPNSINNNVNHSKNRVIDTTDQSVTINTGDLHESMVDQVEEVIYSPMLYLIEFTGEVFTAEFVGLTVDSTLVTVDSTTYTVDNQTITGADVGLYSEFKQHPVTCETSNFVKRTRLNDKGKINYDLTFNKTVGKINNLR